MFDMERSIGEWRAQMLKAGLKSPVPLDELEGHLREEFEQQTKPGLNDEEAFQAAVRKIGLGRALQSEFNKVARRETVLRAGRVSLLILGWLAVGFVLFDMEFGFNWHWNFMTFSPKWDRETATAVVAILAAEAGFWFLARASRDWASRAVSLLVCLCLARYAIYHILPAEPVGHAKNWVEALISRQRPSPIWYRGGLALLCFAPGLFCIGRLWQQNMRHKQYV